MNDAQMLELAARLAATAAEAILAVRAAGFAVERKSDFSPVTAADRAAEAIIVEGLRAATPDIPVIAEEEVEAGLRVAAGEQFWLVDPLDGTREFAAGHDSFAVCVGLVRRGAARLGAVALPASGEVFGGIGPGDGPGAADGVAWKQDAAGRRPIRVRAAPASGAVVMFSRHGAVDPRLDPFLERWRAAHPGARVAEVVNIGSAMKFCRLAEGAADLYPRFGTTMEWDTAAPQAVLEGAGGQMRTLDGAPFRYGKPGFRNGDFLAAGLPPA